jgi:hypothetical protein
MDMVLVVEFVVNVKEGLERANAGVNEIYQK